MIVMDSGCTYCVIQGEQKRTQASNRSLRWMGARFSQKAASTIASFMEFVEFVESWSCGRLVSVSGTYRTRLECGVRRMHKAATGPRRFHTHPSRRFAVEPIGNAPPGRKAGPVESAARTSSKLDRFFRLAPSHFFDL